VPDEDLPTPAFRFMDFRRVEVGMVRRASAGSSDT